MNLKLFKWRLQGAVRSMTIWANGVLLTLIAGFPMLQETLPSLTPYIPPHLMHFFQGVLGAVAAINILLRFRTNKDLAVK